MKRATAVALLVVVAALVAGCGGSSTSTIVRTVTEKVEVEKDSATTAAAAQEIAEKQTEEEEKPSRIVHLKTFRSPSGNIGCALYEGGARCDIRKRDWSPPPRPANCPKQTGYGQGVEVTHGGEAAFVCAGDTALDPSSSSLSYGTASEVEGSECISRKNGVTCVNRAGHGFFLSIQSYQIF